MDAHKIPETIEWHEGLLLTPQHFQQLSLRHESLLQYVSTSIAPFAWGVRREPKIDPASLVGKTLKVIEVEAVMPDRLVVSHRAGRGGELRKDLKPYEEQMKKGPVAVHLAVAAHDGAAFAGGDGARYDSVDGDPVADESTGEGQLQIPRLRPRLTLLVPDCLPDKNYAGNYVSFPLVEVEFKENAFALRADFVAPTLTLPRNSPLGGECLKVAEKLRNKANELAEKLGPGMGSRASLDLGTKHLIRDLVTPLPALEAVLDTDASHPFLVYLALCSVAGHLSVMGNELVPRKFEPYRHNDLRGSFRQVLEYISQKIREGVISSFERYPFRQEGDLFRLHFQRAWVGRPLALGMRGQAGAGEQEVADWARECLIGSGGQIFEWMKDKRHTGAERAPLERDESFVVPPGVVLFSLKPDGFIKPGEDLQIFNKAERGRPAGIELYVGNAA